MAQKFWVITEKWWFNISEEDPLFSVDFQVIKHAWKVSYEYYIPCLPGPWFHTLDLWGMFVIVVTTINTRLWLRNNRGCLTLTGNTECPDDEVLFDIPPVIVTKTATSLERKRVVSSSFFTFFLRILLRRDVATGIINKTFKRETSYDVRWFSRDLSCVRCHFNKSPENLIYYRSQRRNNVLM